MRNSASVWPRTSNAGRAQLGNADRRPRHADARTSESTRRISLHPPQAPAKAEEMASRSEPHATGSGPCAVISSGRPGDVSARITDIVSSHRDKHAGKIETHLPETPVRRVTGGSSNSGRTRRTQRRTRRR
ncbi:hypothetical protein C8039_07925 [Halogeometricum sp. wsp3]|nr:hypothetical protein C8039_07925 [Halogeometricum sp. wsp3]